MNRKRRLCDVLVGSLRGTPRPQGNRAATFWPCDDKLHQPSFSAAGDRAPPRREKPYLDRDGGSRSPLDESDQRRGGGSNCDDCVQSWGGRGVLREVTHEFGVDTDTPIIDFQDALGTINSDLTVGVDLNSVRPIRSNEGIAHDGVKLHGRGFIVSPQQAAYLGLGNRPVRTIYSTLAKRTRPRREIAGDDGDRPVWIRGGGRALSLSRSVSTPSNEGETGARFYIIAESSIERIGGIWGKPRRELRPALVGLSRFIATVDTARHRVFQFLPNGIVCDDRDGCTKL